MENMNIDEIRARVEQEKQLTVPSKVFDKSNDIIVAEQHSKHAAIVSKTDSIVEDVFNQAVVAKITDDDDLKNKMLNTAKKFTETKMKIIDNKVDKEDKRAFFENNESACECFGYDEKDTEKWAVGYMKIWHTIMTAIWVTIGWVTYAPITFIAKKISVIVKRTWIAVIVAIILYFAITLIPLWVNLVKGL